MVSLVNLAGCFPMHRPLKFTAISVAKMFGDLLPGALNFYRLL